ncbi:hypothetical protein HC931_20500 [Candidatus Gracilibacteria bacterium]|nr:hypothetical protein [Candidatus Gracilibacteria bacterium]NJP22439.1 hypothetical protein [Hydrococcus sp. CRU_1_1]
MLSTIHSDRHRTLIRNYLIVLSSVTLLGIGLADICNCPSRIAQQDRLDNYGRYIDVGVASYVQRTVR